MLESTTCTACNCYVNGSTSIKCDSKGQCTCKNNFKGTTCKNRDCEFTNWKGWSACPSCGYEGNRKRTRSMLHRAHGNGKPCPDLVDEQKCKLKKCICKLHEFGLRCENRHCSFGEWSAWTACSCNSCGKKSCYPQKSRSRVKYAKKGSGADCIGSPHNTAYCGNYCRYKCDLHCPPSLTATCTHHCYHVG